MFADENEVTQRFQRKPSRGVWWQDYATEDLWPDEQYEDDAAWYGYEPTVYWQHWWGDEWYHEAEYNEWDPFPDAESYEVEPLAADEAGGDGQEESQLREAYALAGEANKTLAQAREAVRQVRQSRGYYSAEASTGTGLTPSSSPSPTPPPS